MQSFYLCPLSDWDYKCESLCPASADFCWEMVHYNSHRYTEEIVTMGSGPSGMVSPQGNHRGP
jgi:hypothetical protein